MPDPVLEAALLDPVFPSTIARHGALDRRGRRPSWQSRQVPSTGSGGPRQLRVVSCDISIDQQQPGPDTDAWRIGDHGPLPHLRTPHCGRAMRGGKAMKCATQTTRSGGSRRWRANAGAVQRCLPRSVGSASPTTSRLRRPTGRRLRRPIRRKVEGAERRQAQHQSVPRRDYRAPELRMLAGDRGGRIDRGPHPRRRRHAGRVRGSRDDEVDVARA